MVFDQCMVGSITRKPTAILGTLNLGLDGKKCDHPSRWWVVPWSGESRFGPHAVLRGRQLAIPWEEWRESMLDFEPAGPFVTRAAAAYPPALNQAIADAMASCDFTVWSLRLTAPRWLRSSMNFVM